MSRNAYHDHLLRVPMFAGLSADELDAVGRLSTQLDFPAGRELITEGGMGHEMFIIVSGALEVTRDGEHIADLGPGDFAGELALLSHHQRTSTVTCTAPTTVLHIDGREFASMLHDIPQIAVKMLPVVAARAAHYTSHPTST